MVLIRRSIGGYSPSTSGGFRSNNIIFGSNLMVDHGRSSSYSIKMADKQGYKVIVLFDGYSRKAENGTIANCTCTLIKGPQNIIVDTMTAWDGEKLVQALKEHSLDCSDINYVICTHGHSDHIGCNYLFPNATKHIVGFCISQKDNYYDFDFNSGESFIIDECIKVIATPGHTLQDVSVIVLTAENEIVAITGDLFENGDDIHDESIWKSVGSDSVELQEKHRKSILKRADYVIPGHGPMFKVLKT